MAGRVPGKLSEEEAKRLRDKIAEARKKDRAK